MSVCVWLVWAAIAVARRQPRFLAPPAASVGKLLDGSPSGSSPDGSSRPGEWEKEGVPPSLACTLRALPTMGGLDYATITRLPRFGFQLPLLYTYQSGSSAGLSWTVAALSAPCPNQPKPGKLGQENPTRGRQKNPSMEKRIGIPSSQGLEASKNSTRVRCGASIRSQPAGRCLQRPRPSNIFRLQASRSRQLFHFHPASPSQFQPSPSALWEARPSLKTFYSISSTTAVSTT